MLFYNNVNKFIRYRNHFDNVFTSDFILNFFVCKSKFFKFFTA